MAHQPRKRFGQNFLVDARIVNAILDAVNAQASDHIIEIGPGLGALTAGLIASKAKIDAIEIDRDLVQELTVKYATYRNFTLHNADALDLQLADFTTKSKLLRLVGNLPYNISTPLLFILFAQQQYVQDMFFMLQKEVAERLTAVPNNKDYGRLSVMAQFYCEIYTMIDVPPTAFDPQPKVDSAIVYFKPRWRDQAPPLQHEILQTIVTAAFNQRRKTVSNALKGLISSAKLTEIGINPQLRPENLSVADYVLIGNNIG